MGGSEGRFVFDSKDSDAKLSSELYIEQNSESIFNILELNKDVFKSKSKNRNNLSN